MSPKKRHDTLLEVMFTPFMTKHKKFLTTKIGQYIYNQIACFCMIRNIYPRGLSSFSNATQARACACDVTKRLASCSDFMLAMNVFESNVRTDFYSICL